MKSTGLPVSPYQVLEVRYRRVELVYVQVAGNSCASPGYRAVVELVETSAARGEDEGELWHVGR